MKKMTFNLFSRFILWLKKIFRVHPKVEYERETVEVTPEPEEKSIKVAPVEEKPREVSPEGEKPAETPLPEKKTTEVILLPEQRPPEIPSGKEHQEQSEEEIITTEPSQDTSTSPAIKGIETEVQAKDSTEGVKTEEKIIKEEKDTPKLRKPYKKKTPTGERKGESIKPPAIEGKTSSSEQRKNIYLGGTQRRRRWLTGAQREPQSDENIDKEKELAISIESPFVEINLDEADVYLVLPQQRLKANTVYELPQWLSYSLELNGKQQQVLVKTATDKDGRMFVERKRISLEEPLFKFEVAFPDELQGRKYNYNNNDKGLYAFVAIGSNRGRMYYLYDDDGNTNPLPKRDVWILLDEDFELQTEPDVIEERWIWERYQPFRIDLSEIDALGIKNRISGEEKSFSLELTFRAEGEQLIEDDYKKECPLFTGKTLKIVAPYENQSGWSVWIQNKAAGYKIKENWTGREPLTLRCPQDLPCDCGEFQIDICQHDTRIPDETLFLRWMPCIELSYPKELIIPYPKLGHIPSTISVKLDSYNEWGFKVEGSQKAESIHGNFYQLKLPPERDTVRFHIAEQGRPETIVNFQITIPRLKWKTSKQSMWDSQIQKIERRDLKPGESLYLLIKTNDFDNKYDLLALLERNGQKLQEGKFIRKGIEYSLELNQFFDTIKHNEDELTVRVEVRKVKGLQLLGSVETLYFGSEGKIPKRREETTSNISNIQALVKCRGQASRQRKAKGFSKNEVIGAGLNLKDLCGLNIPYDKRRKTSHSWNINTLKNEKL